MAGKCPKGRKWSEEKGKCVLKDRVRKRLQKGKKVKVDTKESRLTKKSNRLYDKAQKSLEKGKSKKYLNTDYRSFKAMEKAEKEKSKRLGK